MECLPTVLLDEAKVITTDNYSAAHLGGDDNTLENAATDGDIACEGALLVDVGALQKSDKEGEGWMGVRGLMAVGARLRAAVATRACVVCFVGGGGGVPQWPPWAS